MCTFTGAKMGAVPCAFTSATWSSASNTTLLQVDSSGSPVVSAQFTLAATPMADVSYGGGMAGTECSISLDDGTKRWVANTVMALGACALSLRSVRVSMMTSTSRSYELHGGFSASLEPEDGVGGTLGVQSSF